MAMPRACACVRSACAARERNCRCCIRYQGARCPRMRRHHEPHLCLVSSFLRTHRELRAGARHCARTQHTATCVSVARRVALFGGCWFARGRVARVFNAMLSALWGASNQKRNQESARCSAAQRSSLAASPPSVAPGVAEQAAGQRPHVGLLLPRQHRATSAQGQSAQRIRRKKRACAPRRRCTCATRNLTATPRARRRCSACSS
jgi:hypothetical protein